MTDITLSKEAQERINLLEREVKLMSRDDGMCRMVTVIAYLEDRIDTMQKIIDSHTVIK